MAANQEDVDEVEDIVGQVTYTDSQKSIPTTLTSSRVYSSDFTDSSEDRNNSSGKETYVVECDSEDSEGTFPLCHTASAIIVNDRHKKTVALNVNVQCATNNILTTSATTSLQRCSFVAQETFTQTSKTIIELAEKEGMIKAPHGNSLQTQTSIMSITENKTVEYRIEVSSAPSTFSKSDIAEKHPKYVNDTSNDTPPYSVDDSSSKFPASISFSDDNVGNDINRSSSSSDQLIKIIADGSEDTIMSSACNVGNGINTPTFQELSCTGSDIEEDSLRSDSPRSGNGNTLAYCDIKELRERLAENENVYSNEQTFDVPDIRRLGGTLTPLTEESNVRKESSVEIAPPTDIIGDANNDGNVELLFTSSTGLKVKMMKNNESKKESFKLPPINTRYQSCPNSPHLLNSLFNNSNNFSKAGTLPCVLEKKKDRWEINTKDLASGESPHICNSRSGKRSSFTYL